MPGSAGALPREGRWAFPREARGACALAAPRAVRTAFSLCPAVRRLPARSGLLSFLPAMFSNFQGARVCTLIKSLPKRFINVP